MATFYAHRRLTSLVPPYFSDKWISQVADVAACAALPAVFALSGVHVHVGGLVGALG